ncbi:hypothetical protein AAVH_25548 [Aphelenchoides avenae]|nr:hypothetical protein AAVH_25548 [Aphelenchus avenae]
MDNWAETLEAPEQGATYVVAMDYNFPCPFTNPAEVAAGANRQDLQRRTLFQIYKLKPGKQWQPANDMGNIKLVTDYTKVMELNMDEVWEWPTFEAFKFRGLVFFDPCIGSELQAQDQLRGILYSLPPSIVVVEFATSLEHAFIPFMTSPARCGANNVVRMPYLKGICEDFFVQLFHNDPPLFLSTRHMTIGIMPNDDVIEPYLL